ncbi:hypothetical protein Pan54_45720 [Rubinisphaera italica]|uniref:Phosphatidylglycerol lysyltransferase n=1 Tax=Rubinisphaera italica TaxID=2527969 RepID=A0A5C5XN72_9PLAN|nr:hypothetical protein Pan54_45720 [Rubinisphaera italica]
MYVFFLGLFFAFKTIRWAWLLKPVKFLKPGKVLGPLMVGFMGNNILPAHLGEFFRVFLLSRQEKIAAGAVLSSVAIERVLDIIAVLLLVGVGMLAVKDVPTAISTGFFYVGLIALAMVVVLALAVIFIQPAVSLACWLIHRLPVKSTWKGHLEELIRAAAAGASVLRDGKLLVLLMTNSALQWSFNCAMIAVSLWSFGIHVPFSATLILLGVLVFAVTIPSSPGFFGAIQVAFVETLKIFGVPASTAFAASIYYHLIQYVLVTAVGFWFLGQSGFSLSRLQDGAEHIEEQELEVS